MVHSFDLPAPASAAALPPRARLVEVSLKGRDALRRLRRRIGGVGLRRLELAL